MYDDDCTYQHHSVYKGYTITKVTQSNGRVTYDVTDPSGYPYETGCERLVIARAEINATEGW